MDNQYNEQDLNFLIEKHLVECEGDSKMCSLKQTDTGKQRIVTRIKEIIFNGGVKNIHGSVIESAIATVEAELNELESGE